MTPSALPPAGFCGLRADQAHRGEAVHVRQADLIRLAIELISGGAAGVRGDELACSPD
jgi:hypothetical protein